MQVLVLRYTMFNFLAVFKKSNKLFIPCLSSKTNARYIWPNFQSHSNAKRDDIVLMDAKRATETNADTLLQNQIIFFKIGDSTYGKQIPSVCEPHSVLQNKSKTPWSLKWTQCPTSKHWYVGKKRAIDAPFTLRDVDSCRRRIRFHYCDCRDY